MTPQPERQPLIPRPERTAEALRAALAQVAPHRLAEMEEQKNEAIALAVDSGSIAPLRGFLTAGAVHLEIARDLETAARLRAAEHAGQTLDRDDPGWPEAMAEIRAVFTAAQQAVNQ